MSRVTKRKHVMKEILDDDFSQPKEDQQIVRICGSRGNNLHEVETAAEEKETFLVSMPTKFRKNVWVKRGDFVIVEPIEEGDKVKGEIIRILTPEHIKIFTKDGIWPKKFTKKRELEEMEINSDSQDDSDDDLVRNQNHKHFQQDSSSDDETTTEDEDDVKIETAKT